MDFRSIKLLPMIFLLLILASSVVWAKDSFSNGEYLAVALNGFSSEDEVRKWAESSCWGGWGCGGGRARHSGRDAFANFRESVVGGFPAHESCLELSNALFLPLRFNQSGVRKDGESLVIEFCEEKVYREFFTREH
jgi:hypothetical protein